MDRNTTSNFRYTEMTSLGKVWQIKPLGSISYSTVTRGSDNFLTCPEPGLFNHAILFYLNKEKLINLTTKLCK